jgi:chromosome segregation ATPase
MPTNPAGVELDQSAIGKSVADGAEQILQSGILDGYESPRPNPEAPVVEATDEPEQAPKEEAEASEESTEEQPQTEESDEETEQEYEEIKEPLYTIKQHGKDESVTLDELKSGYQRNADYTQKTQELSKGRKEFEAERNAVMQERQQYQQALGQFQQLMQEQNSQYENINWAELAEIDPAQYVTKKEEQRDLRDRAAQAQYEQQRIMQVQNAEADRQRQEILSEEGIKMGEAFPDWNDSGKRATLSQTWVDYALTQGYTKDEMDVVSDSRAFKVLDKAMKYDKIQKASAKKVSKVPKTVKPGSPQSRKGAGAKMKNKMGELKKYGRTDDAASIIFDML